MIGRCLEGYVFIAIGQNKRSNDVARGMLASPLGNTHGKISRVWHSIIALVKHTWLDDVGHDIPLSPLGSTHCWMMSSMAFHHLPREEHTVGRRRK